MRNKDRDELINQIPTNIHLFLRFLLAFSVLVLPVRWR